MNIDEALPGFIAESADLLREMEAGLLECACGAGNPETINLIFRTAHTIKGSAGLFGLEAIVAFVHVVETALDQVRLGKSAMTDELVALLLKCKDHIEALLAEVGSIDQGNTGRLETYGAELLCALKLATGEGAPGAARRDRKPGCCCGAWRIGMSASDSGPTF